MAFACARPGKDSIMRWTLCVFAVVALGTMATLPASIAHGRPAIPATQELTASADAITRLVAWQWKKGMWRTAD